MTRQSSVVRSTYSFSSDSQPMLKPESEPKKPIPFEATSIGPTASLPCGAIRTADCVLQPADGPQAHSTSHVHAQRRRVIGYGGTPARMIAMVRPAARVRIIRVVDASLRAASPRRRLGAPALTQNRA